MTIPPLSELVVEDVVKRALLEDLGDAGDITTKTTIPAGAQTSAVIAARKPGIVAGVQCALAAFHLVDPTIKTELVKGDGSTLNKSDAVIRLSGPARGILTAERVALNFLGHLSGVATATAALVDGTHGTSAKIVCTRKTTPGLRALEKHAVRCGGGFNHRFGLYDAVMIKDNHIAAAGSIVGAVKAARGTLGHMVKIEVEADRLGQVKEALAAGADVIMLDNMSPEDMTKAVALVDGHAVLEASGNVTAETVPVIARTGVDIISSGWITHSAPTLDLGMDFE